MSERPAIDLTERVHDAILRTKQADEMFVPMIEMDPDLKVLGKPDLVLSAYVLSRKAFGLFEDEHIDAVQYYIHLKKGENDD